MAPPSDVTLTSDGLTLAGAGHVRSTVDPAVQAATAWLNRWL